MTKRKNLFIALGTAFVSCLAFAFSFMPANVAKAETENTAATVNVETILMREGASVRAVANEGETDEYSGIRFSLYVNKAYYESLQNPVVGVYVTGANLADETAMKSEESIPAASQHFHTVTIEEILTVDEAETIQETYSFNAVIYGIPTDSYLVKMIANGYIAEGEDGAKTFATNPQTRSIAQVASLAQSEGDTRKGVMAYVDAVVTEDNFKFENTAIATDLYKTAEPTLGATMPEGLTVVWNSSDKDVVTVAEDGTLTRGEKLGVSTVTATLGSKTLTANVTVREPAGLIVDENSAANVWNNDIARTFVSSLDLSVEGGYTGNALKFVGGANQGFKIANTYSADELTEIAKDYNRVSMWVALSFAEGTAYFYSTGFEGIAAPGQTNHPAANCNVWMKWTIAMSDYITLLETNNYEYFQPWTDMYAIGITGQISYYFGDVTFSFDPYIVKVDSTNYNTICNNDIAYSYISATELAALNISGDYTGNATKFNLVPYGANNGGYKLKNSYTAEQLTAIKENYNSVSVWMSATGITKASVPSYAAGTYPNYLAAKAGGVSFGTTPEWKKLTISIDVYMELLATTNYEYCPLIRTANYNAPTFDSNGAWLYIGDVFFENVEA